VLEPGRGAELPVRGEQNNSEKQTCRGHGRGSTGRCGQDGGVKGIMVIS